MEMDEFLEVLSGQIRSEKARGMVKKEMEDHIRDQAEAYEESGMSRERALKEAVHQMGDPVAAGVELDRIHRPRMDWSIFTWIVLFSILGLALQYICFYGQAGLGGPLGRAQGGSMENFVRQCSYTVIGLGVMAAVCLADYSVIGRYPRILGAVFLGSIWIICELGFLIQVNGAYPYLRCVTYLFVPLYGGILYKTRGKGYQGIAEGLVWIGLLYLVGAGSIGGGMGVVINAVLPCLLMLFMAVRKRWFALSRGSGLAALLVMMGAWGLFFVKNLRSYQVMRIQAWLRPEAFGETAGYHMTHLRNIVSSLSLNRSCYGILEQRGLMDFLESLGVNSEFMILQTAVSLGLMKAVFLCILFAVFFFQLFLRTARQKNQLGQMTGLGCTMVLAAETLRNIMGNFGIGIGFTGGVPFLSYGKWHTLAVYVLLGILLSIYRHENLMWEEPVERKEGVLFQVGSYVIKIEKRLKSSV